MTWGTGSEGGKHHLLVTLDELVVGMLWTAIQALARDAIMQHRRGMRSKLTVVWQKLIMITV